MDNKYIVECYLEGSMVKKSENGVRREDKGWGWSSCVCGLRRVARLSSLSRDQTEIREMALQWYCL